MLAVALLLGSSRASAQPRMQVTGDSTCPTPAQVAERLRSWARVDGAGKAWRVTVQRTPAAATVELQNPEGEQALRRTIASQDCTALAGAFDAIVRAHLIDLGLVSVAPPAPPSEPPPPTEPEPAPPPAPPPPAAPGWLVAPCLSTGLAMASPGGSIRGAAQLRLAAGPEPSPWRIGVSAAATHSDDQGTAPDRLRSLETWGQAEVGLRLGDRWWAQPMVYGGVVASRVRALDIDGEPRWQPSGMIGALVVAGRRVGESWSLVAEVSQQLRWVRTRYLIEPDGVVGHGPRAVAAVLLGAQLDLRL